MKDELKWKRFEEEKIVGGFENGEPIKFIIEGVLLPNIVWGMYGGKIMKRKLVLEMTMGNKLEDLRR